MKYIKKLAPATSMPGQSQTATAKTQNGTGAEETKPALSFEAQIPRMGGCIPVGS